MPVFFICFIVFIIWMRVKSQEERKKNSTWDNAYWARERESNFVRKKNIDDLKYIQIPESDLPFFDNAAGEEKELQDKVRGLMAKKMLNLAGMTNADIKMEYGTANFPLLSEFDQNYSLFIRQLGMWGCYLYKQQPDSRDRARQILEYAISLGSDISSTWLTLARIYLEEDRLEKIQELICEMESSTFYMKDTITRQLKDIIREYR